MSPLRTILIGTAVMFLVVGAYLFSTSDVRAERLGAGVMQRFLVSGQATVVDIRESEERAAGFIPGTVSARMADIFAGAWREFPRELPVIIHCATGTRSAKVADFLAGKGFQSYYLDQSMEDWIDERRSWQGELPFQDELSRSLKKSLSAMAAYDFVKQGSLIVDARAGALAEKAPIPDSIALPVLELDSRALEQQLRTIPAGASLVIITDRAELSDFSAFLAAVKLHDLGHEVRGIVFQSRDFLSLL